MGCTKALNLDFHLNYVCKKFHPGKLQNVSCSVSSVAYILQLLPGGRIIIIFNFFETYKINSYTRLSHFFISVSIHLFAFFCHLYLDHDHHTTRRRRAVLLLYSKL